MTTRFHQDQWWFEGQYLWTHSCSGWSFASQYRAFSAMKLCTHDVLQTVFISMRDTRVWDQHLWHIDTYIKIQLRTSFYEPTITFKSPWMYHCFLALFPASRCMLQSSESCVVFSISQKDAAIFISTPCGTLHLHGQHGLRRAWIILFLQPPVLE